MPEKDINFDKELWEAADLLRGNVAANEYRDIILGLVFLKYLSDSFITRQEEIKKLCNDKNSEWYAEDKEDIEFELNEKDNYSSANIFWIPELARWSYLLENANQSDIGKKVNDSMKLIEEENKELKGLLPKKYLATGLDQHNLGQIITLLTNITAGTDKDFLGRIYEYYMSKFAERGGSKGGEFFTPSSVVKLLVEMLEPYKGRIFDPACGSGGMFVQSIKFIEAHQGKKDELAIYGQENIEDYVKLCKMNLAIRGLGGEIKMGNSYHNDQFKSLKADFVIANPPFNDDKWGSQRVPDDDSRFKYGIVPEGNANYMWVQHFITHLSNNGLAGFVMANGSMSVSGKEGDIRSAIIEDDLIDCIVALPERLFYTTGIPACLWFISKNKSNRKGKTLFLDARKIFYKVDRAHNSLSNEQIKDIAKVYHDFKAGKNVEDIKGFCSVVDVNTIREHGYVLTPGRYVGVEKVIEEQEPFSEKMERLSLELHDQFTKSRELEELIRTNLERLGYGV